MTAKRVVTIPVADWPGYFDECVTDKPIPCPNCGKYEVCGGINFKFLYYSFTEAMNITLNFVNRANASSMLDMVKMVGRNEVDITPPYATFSAARAQIAPQNLPLFYSRYSAFVKTPYDEISPFAFTKLPAHIVAVLSILLLVIYMLNKLAKVAYPSYKISFWVVRIPDSLFYTIIAIGLSFASSAVTLEFNKVSAPSPPFATFSELAVGIMNDKFRPIVSHEIAIKNLFQQKEGGGALKLLNQAYQKTKPENLAVPDAMRNLFSSNSFSYVFLTAEDSDKAAIHQNYCDVLEIEDSGELPMEMHGFYHSPAYKFKPNWNQRSVMSHAYYFWLNWYIWNHTKVCEENSMMANTWKPVRMSQYQSLTQTFFVIAAVGLIIFAVEIFVNKCITMRKDRLNIR